MVDAERHHVGLGADARELLCCIAARAGDGVVRPRGAGVEPVGDAGGDRGRRAELLQHPGQALVRHHHARDAGPPRPARDPAQAGAVGHLDGVGVQPLEQAGHAAPVEHELVSGAAGQVGAAEGDDVAELGPPVRELVTGMDEHGVVAEPGVRQSPALQRGADAAGARPDEVGQPNDAHERECPRGR
nr:hypothetical protein [Barrientosiimonas endolithica]